MTRGAEPLAEVTRRDERGGRAVVESTHHGHLVVTMDDEPVVVHGDATRATFPRSAVKPIQATTCLDLLAEAGWPGGEPGLDEVAVGWASHRAEDRHLEAVHRLLARAGIAADDLTCPPDVRPDGPPGKARIHHNCSGKHALFALAGHAVGATRADLLDPDGPLQRRVLADLDRALGGLQGVAVDGCGAPAVLVPLVGVARALADVAVDDRHRRVRAAGMAHPGLVGGTGRLETALLGRGTVAKVGAEGIYAAGWASGDRRIGVAVKSSDGSARGAATALAAVVEAASHSTGDWGPEVPLGGGRPVGVVRAADELLQRLAILRDLG